MRIVRLLLQLPQPVYGIANGTLGTAGTMLLEACDYVYSDSSQSGVQANRA